MFETFPRGTKVLVIGASGFIGTSLWRLLTQQGAEVHCFSRTKPPEADQTAIPAWSTGDMSDDDILSKIIRGKEIVFHLAHSSLPADSNADSIKEVTDNVCGSLKVLDACVRAGVRKVIFASSGGTVYGRAQTLPILENATTNPYAAYGISKLSIEKYLFLYRHLYNLDYQILRIANPFGPHQSPLRSQGLIASLIHRSLNDKEIRIFGDGSVVRDYIFIDDVIKAFIASMCYTGDEKIMNVGTGEGRSILDVVREVERALGAGRLSVDRRPARQVDVPANVLDIALIRRETGWRPLVGFEEGLERTVAWMRSQRRSHVN